MPLQLKNGPAGSGSWRAVPASGKLAVLRGDSRKMYDAILAAGPMNFWPLRDPQGVNFCDDVAGTKDTTYTSNNGSDMVNGHPNPFSPAKQTKVNFIGGNPLVAAGTATGSWECIFRCTTAGGIFGYQAVDPANGHVPALYVGNDGKVRGSVYPCNFTAGAGADVRDGRWHHAGITWSGGTAWLIVDGVVRESKSGTPDFAPAWNNVSQLGLTYGTGSGWPQHPVEGWSYFTGDIMFFAVHNGHTTEAQYAARTALMPNWHVAGGVKMKSGGAWRDTGYAGYPGMPSTPTVYAWNYYDVHMVWNEPTTGSPIASFEAQLLDSNGAVFQTQIPVVGGGPNNVNRNDYIWRGLAANGYYQMRVRTKGTNGLYSNWTATLRVKMGQAEIVTPRQEIRERDYYGYTSHPSAGDGSWMTHILPTNCRSTWMEIHVATTPAINPFCDEGAHHGGEYSHRRAHWIVSNQDWGDVGWHSNEWHEGKAYGVGYEYANTHQGIVLTTDGYYAWNSNKGTGSIHLWGYEQYWYYWNDVTPAVANSYW